MKLIVSSLALVAFGLWAAPPMAAAQTRIAAAAVSRPDLTDLGAAPPDTPVSVAITLNYRDASALADLVAQQANPASPLYHQFLTPEQFADRFGPTAAQHDAVVATLRQAGFTILRTYPNRTVIDAAAPASVASAYFRTRIHSVTQYGHGLRYANVTPAIMPAEIAASVNAISGLDNLVRVRPHALAAAGFVYTGQVSDAANAPPPIERTVGGEFAGLFPSAMAKAYDFPSAHGYTGHGHAIGIVMDSDITSAELATYWAAAGVRRSAPLNRVLVEGSNPGITADEAETAIDTETTSSLAPAATIDLYLVSALSDGPIEDAYNLAITNNKDDVVSSSFGGCELDDLPFAAATDAIALQGAALGITFTASTGDTGSYCIDLTATGSPKANAYVVSSPASSPHFVAVGGTALSVNPTTGARVSETAWGPGGWAGGGGGGVSSVWAEPAYQIGVTGMAVVPFYTAKYPALQPAGGFAGRNMPDIALDASNAVGSYLAVYATNDGGWTGYGGTSVASPVFAALVAEQNQKNGSRSGFLNPALYAKFTNSGAAPGGVYGADFYDITSGRIGGFSAKTGYDQATGIGSILGGAY